VHPAERARELLGLIQHSARRAHRLGVRLGSSASLGERGVRSEGIQRVADEEVLVGVGIAILRRRTLSL
jgi:hypothetical protein